MKQQFIFHLDQNDVIAAAEKIVAAPKGCPRKMIGLPGNNAFVYGPAFSRERLKDACVDLAKLKSSFKFDGAIVCRCELVEEEGDIATAIVSIEEK